ncbi:MAG: class I SAM-dependent methyltransferase [Anaerolineae bacterium]|nr:class I SAM-dependent methyltransferase [Anaerolineae bacterium]
MRRFHLTEIEDQSWCPATIRDAATDYLEFAVTQLNPYPTLAALLGKLLRGAGTSRIVDLGAGAGGPWRGLLPALLADHPDVTLRLTDRYPNLLAWGELVAEFPGHVSYETRPIPATAVPPSLPGVRTLFNALHHFEPPVARSILEAAVQQRQGIGVFEFMQRSPVSLVGATLTPLAVLAATPFIRPRRWSHLALTYLLPAVPAVVLWDGLVSSYRVYSTDELAELTRGLDEYAWAIGEARLPRTPIPLTYLLGWPRQRPA